MNSSSKNRTILVTGGAGYIGSHVVVQLAQQGLEPVIIDNFSNSSSKVVSRLEEIVKRRIKLCEGDCRDFGFLEEVFHENKPDGVIHFAAFKSVEESVSNPLTYYENNVGGTINLLKAMSIHGCQQLVFSSSCTVYGNPDHLPVDENTPWMPAESPYGYTKQVCENIIRDQTRGDQSISAVSLRYFNPIGAHPSGLIGELPIGVPSNLVPFITQTAAGLRDELIVFGNDYPTPDGSCIRDYIHVVDLAEAHIQSLAYLDQKKSSYDAFNIGTGKGASVLELVTQFIESTGVNLPYRIGPRRRGDVVKIYASVAKAEEVLQWKAKKSLKEALVDAWNWQQSLSSNKI